MLDVILNIPDTHWEAAVIICVGALLAAERMRSKAPWFDPAHNSRPVLTSRATPRIVMQAHASATVVCKGCARRSRIDPERLIADGRGDEPLDTIRFHCRQCGGGDVAVIIRKRGQRHE